MPKACRLIGIEYNFYIVKKKKKYIYIYIYIANSQLTASMRKSSKEGQSRGNNASHYIPFYAFFIINFLDNSEVERRDLNKECLHLKNQ